MRKFTVLITLFAMFLMVGCAAEQPEAQTESLTFFGRLSAMFQLGSTEEKIAYKLPVDDTFLTIRGEILMHRPAYLSIVASDIETGAVREDLTVNVTLCKVVEDGIHPKNACEYDGEIYRHTATATFNDGAYLVEGWDWDSAGHWTYEVELIEAGSAETTTALTGSNVYPQRPATTNAFELGNISLPFVVIGLFLIAVYALNAQFMRPVDERGMAM